MDDYIPESRRPIANVFRQTAHTAVKWCLRLGVSPDAISYLSIVAAASAAVCFLRSDRHPSLLIVAPLLCYLRLWFNMLDGMVALAAAKASIRGEIVNDLPDRISDVIIFAGVAHSGWMHPCLGYWTAIFALLTAYVGLFGQALGAGRQFGGIMSKPWRMVTLGIGSWLVFLNRSSIPSTALGAHLGILDWTCVIIVAGCIQTMVVRLRRIMVALQHQSK